MFDKQTKHLANIYTKLRTEADDLDNSPEVKKVSPEDIIRMKKEVKSVANGLIRKINAPDLHGQRSEWNVHGNILKRLRVNVLTPGDPKYNSLPTMAVDNSGNLYINYDFYNELKEDAKKNKLDEKSYIEGVFLHEAFHIYNETFARAGDRNMGLWNVATDYVMNRDLVKGGWKLPSLGLIPERRNNNEYWVNVDLQGIAHAAARGGQILDLDIEDTQLEFEITDSTCEEVYDQFQDKFKDIPPELAEAIKKALEEKGEEMDQHPTEAEEGEPGEPGEEGDDVLKKIAKEAAEEATENEQELPERDDEESRPEKGDEDDQPSGGQGSKGTGTIDVSKLDEICKQYDWTKILKGYLSGSLSNQPSGTPERIKVRDPSTYDDYFLGGMKRGRYRTLPPGLKKKTVTRHGEGNMLHGVFVLDTSGSMSYIMEAVRYGLACMCKQLKDRLKIAIVHQERYVDPNSFIELDGNDTIENMVKAMDDAWAQTETGGYGPDILDAVKYLADNFSNSPKYKHFFVVSDAVWTDSVGEPNNFAKQLLDYISQLSPGGIKNDGLCILRADTGGKNWHPFERHLNMENVSTDLQQKIFKLTNYLDIEFKRSGI
jgi:hypothetical protein